MSLDPRHMLGALKSRMLASLPSGIIVRRLPASASNAVLLTFDDGPHPDVTPRVLERLAAYDARAVFFVIGRRLKRAGALLERARAAGHVIGNHSHLHRDRYILADQPQASFRQYFRDCARCQSEVERRIGERPHLFRPPGGRLTPTTLLVPRLLGLRAVNWSTEVKDWSFRETEEARAGGAILAERIAPRDVVLLHDDNPCVLDVLDVVLPALRSKGYDLRSGVDAL